MAETCYDFPELDPKDREDLEKMMNNDDIFKKVEAVAKELAKTFSDILFGGSKNENKK